MIFKKTKYKQGPNNAQWKNNPCISGACSLKFWPSQDISARFSRFLESNQCLLLNCISLFQLNLFNSHNLDAADISSGPILQHLETSHVHQERSQCDLLVEEKLTSPVSDDLSSTSSGYKYAIPKCHIIPPLIKPCIY